jgi:hypothetical protein
LQRRLQKMEKFPSQTIHTEKAFSRPVSYIYRLVVGGGRPLSPWQRPAPFPPLAVTVGHRQEVCPPAWLRTEA